MVPISLQNGNQSEWAQRAVVGACFPSLEYPAHLHWEMRTEGLLIARTIQGEFMCSNLTQAEEIELALKETVTGYGVADAPNGDSAGGPEKTKGMLLCYTSAYRAAYMKSHSSDDPQPVSRVTKN
jgi:hypothetical protein